MSFASKAAVIMRKARLGAIWELEICPVCKERKPSRRWLCTDCNMRIRDSEVAAEVNKLCDAHTEAVARMIELAQERRTRPAI